jgi:hypothetical protein
MNKLRVHAFLLMTAVSAAHGRGFKLYADAKAEFDGLVTELRFDVTNGRKPTQSPTFNKTLQAAAEKRVAFTSFMSDEVNKVGDVRLPGLPDVIKLVPDLVKAITESGLSIWKESRQAGKEHRDAMLSKLDRLRWRSFAELVPN